MSSANSADFHTTTGYSAVDSVRYRMPATVEAHRHAETGVLLYRTLNFGRSEITTATRTADENDLLFLSSSGNFPAFGKLAGTDFATTPHPRPRVTFAPRGADSTITFGTSARSTSFMFPRQFLAELVAEEMRGEFAPLLFRDDERIATLIRLLEQEITHPGFAARLMIDGLSQGIATALARLDPKRINHDAERIYLPQWRLRRVLDYIESKLGDDITLDALAHVAGLSAFHFCRVFKRTMGTSPYHYVRQRRLLRATELLAASDMPVCELALSCGFTNQSHFTAAFSKAMGIAPAKYRRQLRN